MTQTLAAERRHPRSGDARSLILLLHGYGADARDLIGLADPLGEALPGAMFVSPEAPETCRASPVGRQWFPVPFIDGSSEAESQRSAITSYGLLTAFLRDEMQRHGVTASQTAVLGFSQGATLALHLAIQFAPQLACVVGLSGRFFDRADAQGEMCSASPTLLVHGDRDELIPPEHMEQSAIALAECGVEVRTHLSPDTGHAIAPCGLHAVSRFLAEFLPDAGPPGQSISQGR